MKKGQWLAFDATLALCAALIFSVALMKGSATSPSEEKGLALERAGYDMVNAFYADPALGASIAAALEKRGYMNETEMEGVNATLKWYAQELGVKRVELEVAGGQAIVTEAYPLPATQKGAFYAAVALKNGSENRLVRLALWR